MLLLEILSFGKELYNYPVKLLDFNVIFLFFFLYLADQFKQRTSKTHSDNKLNFLCNLSYN